MEPLNFYYTLPALAEKWNKSDNDLLRMATLGGLVLSVKHNSVSLTLLETKSRNSGYVQLELSDVQSILEFGIIGSYEIFVARWDGQEVAFNKKLKKRGNSFSFTTADMDPPLIIKSNSDIFIHYDEVVRVETLDPEIAQKSYNQNHSQQPVVEDRLYVGNKDIASYSNLSDNCLRTWMEIARVEFTRKGRSPALYRSQIDMVKAARRASKQASRKKKTSNKK